jgi:uncharacterized protein (UPF0332 family)
MNDNVKNLLQMSKDCLEDAQILFEKQRFEGTANRSYYAYFDAVRALCNERGLGKIAFGNTRKICRDICKNGCFTYSYI